MSMTDLTVFRRDGVDVRVLILDGEPWWVAADVAKALGIVNGRNATARLDQDGVRLADVTDALRRRQSVTVVDESALYELILRSDKPEARDFRRWVTREVLPSIRKTGQYVAPASDLDQIRALHAAVGTLLERQAIDAPKVEAFDRFLDSSSLIKIEVAARQAGVGRQTAFRLMREAGILQRLSKAPMQTYAHRFKEVPATHENSIGEPVITYTTKVRPEHFEWLVDRLEQLAGRKLA